MTKVKEVFGGVKILKTIRRICFFCCFPAIVITLIGCKHIYTEIEIQAPPKTVWAILVDLEKYPEWNPYHVEVLGKLELGESLNVTIHKPNGDKLTIAPHVMQIIPQQELTWGGGIKGLFHGEHVFIIETTKEGNSKLIHKEDFDGIFVPFASLDTIKKGYHQMNVALKKRAEQ